MRPLYFAITFLLLVGSATAQHRTPQGDICAPPAYPLVYPLAAEEPAVVTSRSGNNYKIPFDTVKFNPVLGSKGFDIVICIDGVINDTQVALADNYVDSFIRKLQTIPHYAQRFQYINVYRIAKLSNQQGSAYGFTNQNTVDNRYGSRFNAYGLPRLLIPTKLDTLFADVDQFVQGCDLIMMLAFDKKYGGSGWDLFDGHKVTSFSIDEEYGVGSYHLGDEVAIHEMQHVMPFAGHTNLADEYEDSYACSIYDTLPLAYRNSPNYTSDTVNARKWQYWIDAGTPGVGFYDSAGICPGNYRPTQLCAMRQVFDIPTPGVNRGMPPFCPVCRENSTAYLDSVINPVYYTSPPPVNFTGTYTFQALVDTPANNTFRNQWILDDSIVATGTNSFLVNFNNLSTTTNHVLKFVCTDMDMAIRDTTLRRPWTTVWNLLTREVGVSLTETINENSITLFPNPAANQLSITVKGFTPGRIAIFDMNGREISSQKFSPQVDISGLAAGTYFIEIAAGDTLLRKSFVKE